MPSRDFTREDLFSSRMMSMHSSTHSSQMYTVGPAMSLRTSCWLFPQKEQKSVFLGSLPVTLAILVFRRPRGVSIPHMRGVLSASLREMARVSPQALALKFGITPRVDAI